MEGLNILFAEDHDRFEAIEAQLLHDGFRLYDIQGRRMKYYRQQGGRVEKADIFMAFWEV